VSAFQFFTARLIWSSDRFSPAAFPLQLDELIVWREAKSDVWRIVSLGIEQHRSERSDADSLPARMARSCAFKSEIRAKKERISVEAASTTISGRCRDAGVSERFVKVDHGSNERQQQKPKQDAVEHRHQTPVAGIILCWHGD
jgi:hypothetical protein